MAKKQTTAVTKWDEEFAKLAVAANKGFEIATAKFISFKSGVMTYAGAKLPGNVLECIVVGAVYENQYYDPDKDYNPDEPQTPLCYAFGHERECKDASPHDASPKPQHSDCASCPNNEFGSADRGDGKACKNVLRLALISPDDLGDIASAEIIYAKIAIMSVKNWALYVKKTLEPLNRPYWAVITKISLEPDDKSQFRVNFELVEKLEDAKQFQPLRELWDKTMEGIDFPYQIVERTEKPRGKAQVKNTQAKANKFAKR